MAVFGVPGVTLGHNVNVRLSDTDTEGRCGVVGGGLGMPGNRAKMEGFPALEKKGPKRGKRILSILSS